MDTDKPTFDCSRARSLTAQTLCSDRAGASADWSLITAYWSLYFTLPESQREGFDQAHQDCLQALNQRCPRAQNPRECVLGAYDKRAAAYRSQLVGDALAESHLTPEQHARIQQSLAAFGFLDGEIDGEFGSVTRSAIRRLKEQTGDVQSNFLSANQRAELLEGRLPKLVQSTPLVSPAPPAPPPQAPAPAPPVASAPPPRIETAKLMEARVFFDDTKKFISEQKRLPAISEIANEAANLQLALNQYDEHGAVETKQKLYALLKPIPGFSDFLGKQQQERDREAARLLTEARVRGRLNESFIDGYLQAHLGDSTTQPLLSLRGKVESAVKSNAIEEITKVNDAVASYIKNNGLTDAYDESVRKSSQPDPPPAHTSGTICDSLTEKSEFLCKGQADEIILLYNASPSAPKVWKNLRGDVVFQDDSASICFAQPSIEMGTARYVDHYVADRGARKISPLPPPCDLSSAAKKIDLIAFQRGDLLKGHEEYLLALAKLLEGDIFRRYEIISDYASVLQKREALSRRIKSELSDNSRQGFGVISVSEVPVACVVPPPKSDRSDGLKELLKRNADVIAPGITAEWQYLDKSTVELAFFSLQRHQCGYLLGDDSTLREIMVGMHREEVQYSVAPVWWNEKEVDEATFDARDAAQQAIIKKKEAEQRRQSEAELQAARDRDRANEKTEMERRLREANGTKARGLMNYVHDLVRGMADQRHVENSGMFPTYSHWLVQRFTDKWQTFDVSSDVLDYGTVQWEGRQLEAVVVKTTIHQKNRILGKYDEQCYLFGFANDEEFAVYRESFSIDCGQLSELNKWKIGERFHSRWNVD